ncbi:TPA: type II toxin-antitoxin system RelE/ParE family toxin [Enterobacter cancerogenus]|uniref:type II toxin-antitoxin system RelE/ParE family toxin n=1 Tax=Enterobacter cancerogenus TaxID=69218 RepID=UPI0001826402|nr:type II toxin-antitoxin system RelE/ParE family toxin [Enterobacter cancerogenus]EFC55377.1 toxin-antitoxin system, toxin component, RelE family [Enterobacter cancerogenus ATCC 35316]KTQ45545.1 RelE toxin protein [Enterobacter cancerogenus]KTQ53426.1 RelE toxin protein [Enterobacter cancerogenus]KTQ74076.1 RelE toxin protein [Enterobacter cancerogenus]KTQ83664.1 RelE toxin protein [Enterobacter cancerogenus]
MFRLIIHEAVREEILALPAVVQAELIRQLDKLRANPTVLREPDSKPLPHGLFEIRTVGLIQRRGIYVYQRERTLFLLRVFIKKTQKTPSAEISLALKRQQEMLDEQENNRLG